MRCQWYFLQTDVLNRIVDHAIDVSPFSATVYGFVIVLLVVGNIVTYRLYLHERTNSKELSEKALEVASLIGRLQVMIESQKDLPLSFVLVRDKVEQIHLLLLKLLKAD